MNRLIKRLYALCLLAAIALSASAAGADGILKKTVDKITSAPSVVFKFTASASNGRSSNGTLTMDKQKFCYETTPLKVWYDGKKQWTLVDSSKEVNLTEPTAEEILESNPFSIISGYSKSFNAKVLSKTSTSCTVMLTPKSKGSTIKSAEITINTKTSMPEAMKIVINGSQTMNIAVISSTIGKALPASTFTYQPKMHPGYTVVDLR